MYRGVCVSVPLLTLLVLTLVVPMGQACPRSCNCYQANEVHCTFRSLLSIPSGLPIHTHRINFGFNSISTIHDSSLAGLKKVELLMLHSNDLHHLPDEAFRDLKSLQILKLSYNKLREISSSLTFSGLTSLLRLYLDHNRLQHIHPRALLQLPSLRLLRLQGNRLHQLHPRTLCTLSLLNTYYFSTLRHLDLSNNSLTTLPRDTLATAPLLETLVLQANPWSCDCRMNWFLTWSLAHPGLMKCPGGPQCPICASPDSLQGEQVGPPVTATVGKPISLSCKAFGSPVPHINWVLPDGNLVRQGLAVSGLHFPQGHSQLLAGQPRYELHYKKKKGLAMWRKKGERILAGRKRPRPLQPFPNRRLPIGKPVRRGPMREGALRRGGTLTSSTDQRRTRFKNRHRVTTNKQRIDPKKWADLLAKIRQKTVATNESGPVDEAKPTAEDVEGGQDGDTVKPPSTTTTAATPSKSSTTTTTMITTSTTQSPIERPNSGGSNQNRPSIDWRNPGTNYIPDSGSSRPQWPPSPSLPAAPGVPVVRSRPRIADPHIRTVSVPAESTARLACEAQGEPKPSITWTKVSTERFEVLTNGTLVIQNIELQDRGTYICSAQSFLGRDRLLANLEVWTRPPRMQLASYREVTIHQGGEVHLQCQADGVPSPLLSWVLPDRSVLTSSAASTSRIIMDTNGTLHIPVTLTGDRGVYRCVASNSAGAASASARVHVSSLPPVIQQAKEEHLLLSPGRPVYAHCSARGAPTPTLRWRIPDGTIVRQSQFLHGNLFVLPNGTLHIRGVRPKDSGNYECIASNAVGTDKRTVSKALIVSTSPSSSTVHYGLFLQLHCSVTGNPAPIIIWRTPIRKLVDMHYSFDHRLKVHPNGTLSIRALTEKDAGDYLCIARNKVSDDYRRLRVSVVTEPAKIEPKQPLNQMVSFGTPLKVDCQASGLPDPSVRWSLPDGTMVNSVLQGEDRGGRTQRLTVFDNGTLLVPAVGMGEEGEYTCYAENQGGQDTMKVKVKIMMTSLPTFTDDRSHHVVKVREGATATIPCQATGVPAPMVTWFSPTRRVIPKSLVSGFYSERVVVVSGGTLEVRLAQKIDTGTYTCRASNSAGERSMLVGLEVEAVNHGQSGRVGGRVKQRAVKGQTLVLPCLSQGSPPLVWPGFCLVTVCCQLLTMAADSLCTETALWSCEEYVRAILGP
ncbi:hypothetical protein KUCAC02_009803 [Chaenocephalus aceratus]|uniref:Uncharacterized protein n=1 Tax=Chaenocephalus aceratus TaxID=36190 RepID=A0ACB9VY16_CHAAC|nr:hypothetical protein KUCAC02_009803 [Chaenocephalus aceratus]